MINNIYIIGVGLIGGSLALDIKRKRPEATIYGIDNSEQHIAEALELQVIDAKATLEDLDKADLVILSIPVDAAVAILPQVLDKVSDFGLVVDVGSTKLDICKVVEHHPKRRNFLAMHPIAGTEFYGPKASILDLFQHKTKIV